jgi:CBS-domain-containing membrane protein
MMNFHKAQAKLQNYWFKLFGRWKSCPLTCPVTRPHHRHIFWSWFGSCCAIAGTAYLATLTNSPLIMAPFGSTSVLIFAVPESPLSQPRNVIGGNILAAIIGLIILNIWGSSPLTMGLAVATVIAVMQMTNTLHPPSGAIALVVIMTKPNWQFIIAPTLGGSIILVVCAVIFNNIADERSYPRYWL